MDTLSAQDQEIIQKMVCGFAVRRKNECLLYVEASSWKLQLGMEEHVYIGKYIGPRI